VRDPFDRGSKWLIGHHGSAVLRLGGVERIRSWRALQAELTHPRQLPDGLLAVTQVMTRLRYNDLRFLAIFGGKQAMIDSPLIQELLAETRAEAWAEAQQKAILRFLSSRFGLVPPEIVFALQPIHEKAKLDDLVECAARCPSLEAFRARLA
jgi:hypothetical protein